jgi:dihydroorotase
MIEIVQPDDFHHHLRDNEDLCDVIQFAAINFSRIVVMPNLKPPVRNLSEVLEYKNRILSFLPESTKFAPLMTIYLTDMTTITDVTSAKQSGFVFAAKLYPAGATTNSEFGVTEIEKIYPVLQVSFLYFLLYLLTLKIILCSVYVRYWNDFINPR